MPKEIRRILGQLTTAASAKTLYTVPSLKSAVVSSINVCNRAATAYSFRTAILPSGAGTVQNKHYLDKDTAIPANSRDSLKLGITLAENDSIVVQGSDDFITFSAFGVEIEQ